MENPNGTQEIKLHVLVDEAIPLNESPQMWRGFDELKDSYFGRAEDKSSESVMDARRLVYRCCTFGHMAGEGAGAIGLAELPGNDFACVFGPGA